VQTNIKWKALSPFFWKLAKGVPICQSENAREKTISNKILKYHFVSQKTEEESRYEKR
jgi:hypothetical protein